MVRLPDHNALRALSHGARMVRATPSLPLNITPSSSPGTLSTSTLYDCWRSIKFPFFHPTNGTIICTLPL